MPAGCSEAVPEGVLRVALTVDADDAALEELLEAVPVDMLQLHGRESPGAGAPRCASASAGR